MRECWGQQTRGQPARNAGRLGAFPVKVVYSQNMRTSKLDYELPPGLIAQHPVVPRDHSRLLVYDRATSVISHHHLSDIPAYLNPGDILVYNDSRVIRARMRAVRLSGGRVELLFLRRRAPGLWEALAKPSGRLREGEELDIPAGMKATLPGVLAGPAFRLAEHQDAGRWLVKNISGVPTEELLESLGEMPLPPYIHEKLKEPALYQTVYASEPGSAAAPTAGLHFTPGLMARLHARGVAMHSLTLHIGIDTFRPVSEADLGLHQIHREQYRMPTRTRDAVLETRQRGGRVIAVGTTSVRVLETVFAGPDVSLAGETGLFITPGFKFQAVDALLTNFHLPRSTLLALVMAFGGVDEVLRIYRQAVREQYRFFSFGDAMLLQ